MPKMTKPAITNAVCCKGLSSFLCFAFDLDSEGFSVNEKLVISCLPTGFTEPNAGLEKFTFIGDIAETILHHQFLSTLN